jgi:hypothetical protein
MITSESMGRRACKDGDEQDYLTSFHRYVVCNHGVRSKVKTISRRRTRRQVRAELRSGRYDG